jgi:hypothetical protein
MDARIRTAIDRFVHRRLGLVRAEDRAAWFDKQCERMARPAPPQPCATPEPTWQALPGQMIELGDTGFQIRLDVRPMHPLYLLVAPEGWTVLGGADLPVLKQLGERFARERMEFVFVERQP